ncbi:MAG: biotin-dependent carboxyltransferase family protein [Chloroflexota bacterium]|nr:biotin-dependent carboxyltransferase family protein [Chloroflexota bacterium]
MNGPALKIIQPGMLSTIQDRGRYGYQRFGMPTAGAMDTFALRAANALLGNDDNAACIEATVLGPRVEILVDIRIAITGADLSPRLNGEPLPMWTAVRAGKGDTLDFGGPADGVRAYIAVSGGIDVPQVMGSRATYMKAAIGGIDGKPLRAGDILNVDGTDSTGADAEARPDGIMPQDAIPQYGSEHVARVVLGPQDASFTAKGINTLLSAPYTVSINSDRMGYRLEGDPIEHVDGADVISDGTPLGTIQVPGDGQPIILLADRGTTGGYTKIATVISPDLSKIAQAMPGHTISFRAVTVEEAQAAYRAQERLLASIRSGGGVTDGAAPRIALVMDDSISDILDGDGEPLTLPAAAGEQVGSRSGTSRIGGATYEFEITVRRMGDSEID